MPQQRGEPLGGDQAVAVGNELGNLVPVDHVQVQAEADPALRTEIRGPVETIRLGGDHRLGSTRGGLAAEADDAVAVVVDEVVDEGLVADEEAGVLAPVLTRRLGEAEADVGEANETAIFGGRLRHQMQFPGADASLITRRTERLAAALSGRDSCTPSPCAAGRGS